MKNHHAVMDRMTIFVDECTAIVEKWLSEHAEARITDLSDLALRAEKQGAITLRCNRDDPFDGQFYGASTVDFLVRRIKHLCDGERLMSGSVFAGEIVKKVWPLIDFEGIAVGLLAEAHERAERKAAK